MAAWNSMTEAQAIVIAALLTVLAAVVGVVLGWALFSSKVRDLTSALDESQAKLDAHRDHVTDVLEDVQEKVGGLDEQVAAILAKTASAEGESEAPDQAPAAGNRRSELKDCWLRIRDRIEQIAADPEIDGRTRAKYGRIDRRNYTWLLEALAGDNRLPNADLHFEAVTLWHRFKSNRAAPTVADIRRMEQLAAVLAP